MKGKFDTRRAERRFLKKYVFSLKKEIKPRTGLHAWNPYEYVTLAIGLVFMAVIGGWIAGDYLFTSPNDASLYISPEMLAQAPTVDTTITATTENIPADTTSTEKELVAKASEKETPTSWYKTYTVSRRDTSYYRIAKKNGVSLETLMSANVSLNGIRLKAGMALRVPRQNGLVYKVQRKDTLDSIAKSFDLKVASISRVNGISTRRKLSTQQELFLPGAKETVMLAKATPVSSKVKSRPVEMESNSAQESAPKTITGDDGDTLAQAPSDDAESTKPIQVSQGGFVWPSGGRITSGFGYRQHPMGGGKRFHRGLDIATEYGTPVRAAQSGKVIHAGWYGLMGKCVIIQHEDGYVTYYAHLSRVDIDAGVNVARGQHIGDVGSTGLSTGPHLHFEVRRNNVPINPIRLVH